MLSYKDIENVVIGPVVDLSNKESMKEKEKELKDAIEIVGDGVTQQEDEFDHTDTKTPPMWRKVKPDDPRSTVKKEADACNIPGCLIYKTQDNEVGAKNEIHTFPSGEIMVPNKQIGFIPLVMYENRFYSEQKDTKGPSLLVCHSVNGKTPAKYSPLHPQGNLCANCPKSKFGRGNCVMHTNIVGMLLASKKDKDGKIIPRPMLVALDFYGMKMNGTDKKIKEIAKAGKQQHGKHFAYMAILGIRRENTKDNKAFAYVYTFDGQTQTPKSWYPALQYHAELANSYYKDYTTPKVDPTLPPPAPSFLTQNGPADPNSFQDENGQDRY